LHRPTRHLLLAAISLVVAFALLAPLASAAVPTGFVGITADELFGRAGPFRDKNLRLQHAAGIQLVRQTFSWKTIELAPNNFDYSLYDRYVGDLAKNGLTVLPVLFDAPAAYARQAKHGFYLPRDPAQMGRWAASLVDRYGPNGSFWRGNPTIPAHPVRAWQIWNEPSIPAYEKGVRKSSRAKKYVQLLKAVGSAIRARDPGAEIVTAGIPNTLLNTSVRLLDFIKQMYKAGGKSAFDTLAVNSYAKSAPDLKRVIGKVRKLMNSRGSRSKKIWITEVGWCDKKFLTKPRRRHRICVGTKGQVRNIRESLKLIRKTRKRFKLRGFVYYSWRDQRPYGIGDQWGLHTGLLTLKGKKKPAYKAFVRGVRPF
jgi:Glycosyl hydrolase catalytic core